MLENLKILKQDMENKGWKIDSFVFTYKAQDYIVLIDLYSDEKKPKYALVKLEFFKRTDIHDKLVSFANSRSLMVDIKTLRKYFGIEYTENIGDIIQEFTAYFNTYIPLQVINNKEDTQISLMVTSLSKRDGEDANKLYCFKVKRNSEKKDKTYGQRSIYNDNKTRLLRPDLYEKLKDETTVSFCYSSIPEEGKTDEEIIANWAKVNSKKAVIQSMENDCFDVVENSQDSNLLTFSESDGMDEKIVNDLIENYGITFNSITPVTGGYLNKKWKISTEKGELLVKQFSTVRFRKKNIESIESMLQRQVILEKGIPCPSILKHGDRVIHWMDRDTAYMVMNFCSGKTEGPDTITIKQMNSLGSTCAIMHKAFSQIPLPSDLSLPTTGSYTMDALWGNFHFRMDECNYSVVPDEYKKALYVMEPILNQLNSDFYDKFPKGYAHEDFHSGNILFEKDCVSAVLDFDRNCYSYIWHDIGRAIMSFALEGTKMNVEKVHAFLEGYSKHLDLTLTNIVDAMKLTWCIETAWWIQPYCFRECNEVPKRFKDEMLWLGDHWFEIDSIVCS